MNKKYKFLGETSFICFAEHYNEFIDYIKEYIYKTDNKKSNIILNRISILIKEKIVCVSYSYLKNETKNQDLLSFYMNIPFDEFNSLTILNK